MGHRRVFLDTNVIIECFRIGVWSDLAQGHQLETVDEVVTEALTGDTSRAGHVSIDRVTLLGGLAQQPHSVSKKDRNKLLLQYPGGPILDAGELNLFAYLNAHELPLAPLIVVGTADKGAITFAKLPGWLDQLVSLEELLRSTGTPPAKLGQLGPQHHAEFLSNVRTKVILGIIP
jgi:hypothetical protein